MRRFHHLIPLLACACALGAATPAAAAPVGDCRADSAWPDARPGLAADSALLANAHRERIGLRPLLVSPALTAAAEWKARHMAALGYFEHEDPAPPVARTPDQRAQACGYPEGVQVAENLAMGATLTPSAVLAGWLGSDGHRRILQSGEYAATGIGVAARRDGTLMWAQVFGAQADAGAYLPAGSASAPEAPPAPAPAPAPAAAPPPGSVTVALHGCRRSRATRHRATCRMTLSAPVWARARLVRHGRTMARGRLRANAAGATRVRLRGHRRLARGPVQLVVRVGASRLRFGLRLR